jgi:hypothetical protein
VEEVKSPAWGHCPYSPFFQLIPILHAEVSAPQRIKILPPSLAEEGLGMRAFSEQFFKARLQMKRLEPSQGLGFVNPKAQSQNQELV